MFYFSLANPALDVYEFLLKNVPRYIYYISKDGRCKKLDMEREKIR